MKSRLETTNAPLANKIRSVPFSDAQHKVGAILFDASQKLSRHVAELLPKIDQISTLSATRSQVDILDSRYFDLEEGGDLEGSNAAFMAARFLSAVRMYQSASNHFELCEAVYEVGFAVDSSR